MEIKEKVYDELIDAALNLLEKTGCNDPDCCNISREEAKARERLRKAVHKAEARYVVDN